MLPQSLELKPYDRVLVQNDVLKPWEVDIFVSVEKNVDETNFNIVYNCFRGKWYYCTPFDEKLLGTRPSNLCFTDLAKKEDNAPEFKPGDLVLASNKKVKYLHEFYVFGIYAGFDHVKNYHKVIPYGSEGASCYLYCKLMPKEFKLQKFNISDVITYKSGTCAFDSIFICYKGYLSLPYVVYDLKNDYRTAINENDILKINGEYFKAEYCLNPAKVQYYRQTPNIQGVEL